MAVIGGSGLVMLTPTTPRIGKQSSAVISPPTPVNRHRRSYRGIIAASPSSSPLVVTSTGFPPSIEIPDIKFYPSQASFNIFDNRIFSHLFNDHVGRGKLHKLGLRMIIRDDDGVIEDTFHPFWLTLADLLSKRKNLAYWDEISDTIQLLTKKASACLLEHVDSWICGYSFVTFVESDWKFNDELEKLEPVLSHYARGGSMETTVRSAEIILRIGVYGNICDRDIYSREDLVDLLQQLNALESNKDTILHIMPMCFADVVSKEKVDEMEDYAHICLGKLR